MNPSLGMNETHPPRHVVRSIGAVFAGLIFIFALTTIIDIVLHLAKVYPGLDRRMTDLQCVIATSYRLIICIFGCYLTAKLAPDHPLKHALILGGIGFVLSTAGAFAMWDKGPIWYPILLIVTAMPCAWAGGKLFAGGKV